MGSGDAALSVGVGAAVYVDEYTTDPGQTGPVQSLWVTGSNDCTLSSGTSTTWLYEQEGIPSLATVGSFLTFPCYSTAIGSTLSVSIARVAALVSYNSAVSTSTSATLGTGGGSTTIQSALRTTVSNGVGVWWAMQQGASPYSTLEYQALGTTSASLMCDNNSRGSKISGAFFFPLSTFPVPTTLCRSHLVFSSLLFRLCIV